jgi:transposase
VLIVWNDPVRVERELRDQRLRCPHCDGALRPWGHARLRVLRSRSGTAIELRPRRARCASCTKTSVLLPDPWLLRRVDEVAVIGAALLQCAAGAGHRKIAVTVDRPPETVRGWLRRYASKVEALLAHFRHWALALDARLDEIGPQGSIVGDALEAIGLATRAATIAFGPRPPWSWASAMTGGMLLSHTSSPFPLPH